MAAEICSSISAGIAGDGYRSLAEGAKVSYEAEEGPEGSQGRKRHQDLARFHPQFLRRTASLARPGRRCGATSTQLLPPRRVEWWICDHFTLGHSGGDRRHGLPIHHRRAWPPRRLSSAAPSSSGLRSRRSSRPCVRRASRLVQMHDHPHPRDRAGDDPRRRRPTRPRSRRPGRSPPSRSASRRCRATSRPRRPIIHYLDSDLRRDVARRAHGAGPRRRQEDASGAGRSWPRARSTTSSPTWAPWSGSRSTRASRSAAGDVVALTTPDLGAGPVDRPQLQDVRLSPEPAVELQQPAGLEPGPAHLGRDRQLRLRLPRDAPRVLGHRGPVPPGASRSRAKPVTG